MIHFLKKVRRVKIFAFAGILLFSACGDDSKDTKSGTKEDAIIDIFTIRGVAAPVTGAKAVTAIDETEQFTGSVSWNPSEGVAFAGEVTYAATIVLTPKQGYTLSGVAENFFVVAGATRVSNSANSGEISVEFPATAPAVVSDVTQANPKQPVLEGTPDSPQTEPAQIRTLLVQAPVFGSIPVSLIDETDEYTGTVEWSPNHEVFQASTDYTATITLTAKRGSSLNGVTADLFSVVGATSVEGSSALGVLTAKFPRTTAVLEGGFADATEIADQGSVMVGSEHLKMNYANNLSRIRFPISTNATFAKEQIVELTTQFFISETPVTNAVFKEVLQWAYDNEKFSPKLMNYNALDKTVAKHGGQILIYLNAPTSRISYSSGKFLVEAGFENHPVVFVSWYGAVMFCNWLTEMRDGHTDNVVYTGITARWSAKDALVENINKSGYRLPSSNEWEYAARYQGTDTTNAVTGTVAGVDFGSSLPKWTKDDSASGATQSIYEISATRMVGWFSGDPSMGTNNELMPVKGKKANALGLYDMSGNVWEWCFDTHYLEVGNFYRVKRGGSWAEANPISLRVGYWSSERPEFRSKDMGFRFVRSAE
jgi:formylglycine-generating enzyme required for sulfatase activity